MGESVNMRDMVKDVVSQSGQVQFAWIPKCLGCIGEYHLQSFDASKGILRDGEPTPEADWDRDVEDAVTFAPQWFPAPGQAGMAGIMGIAVVPTCARHLRTDEKTLQQRATESGLVLP
jgi:hypothetical protein